MSRQNRVIPNGDIVAMAARGRHMGNRGRLHNPDGRIVRAWQTKTWITCLLEFKDRQRKIMSPNSYTELFFLDEATSFAAGHRPCGECRRQDFKKFKEYWNAANPGASTGQSIKSVDNFLHQERLTIKGCKRMYEDYLKNLPNGTMFIFHDAPEQYFTLKNDRVLKWTAKGYESYPAIPGETLVHVLTPRSVVNTFAYGYEVDIGPISSTVYKIF